MCAALIPLSQNFISFNNSKLHTTQDTTMRWDDPRRNPYHDPDTRTPGWLLCLIAVAVAIAVTAIAWVILYLREVFSARPLG